MDSPVRLCYYCWNRADKNHSSLCRNWQVHLEARRKTIMTSLSAMYHGTYLFRVFIPPTLLSHSLSPSPLLPHYSDVTLGEIRRAVQSLDPATPPLDLLSWGFAIPVEQVPAAEDMNVPLTKLLERLQRRGATRSGPHPSS